MPWWQTYFDETYLDLCQQLGACGPEEAREQAEAAVRMMGITRPARILDLCCGTGTHAVPLAGMGFGVSGLDLSSDSLERARQHAAEVGVEVEFGQGDMREIAHIKTFDGCVMMGGSFGVFEEETENEQVLHAVAAALRPGGRFFLDVANRDSVAGEVASEPSAPLAGGRRRNTLRRIPVRPRCRREPCPGAMAGER